MPKSSKTLLSSKKYVILEGRKGGKKEGKKEQQKQEELAKGRIFFRIIIIL